MISLILTSLKFISFGLSELGFVIFLRSFFHYNKYLAWATVFVSNILFLYLFAMLGFLSAAAEVMFVVGLFLLLYFFITGVLLDRKPSFTFDTLTIWLIFYFFVIASALASSHLLHYDNYSHWELIVKFLFVEGRIPGASDTIITFTSYPLASSLFIYYVADIVGFSSGTLLLGQFFLLFSCMYALFAVIRDRRIILTSALLCLVITIFNIFNIAIRMDNLLVDFLLPMVTLAGISGLISYQKNYWKMIIHGSLFFITLSLIKNSGIFFSLIVWSLLVFYLFRYCKKWKHRLLNILNSLVILGISCLPIILWNKHVKDTFSLSKHEVSVSAYETLFGEKGHAIIELIIHRFINKSFSLSTLAFQGIIEINLILLISFLVIHFVAKRKNSLLSILIFTDLMIISYYVGMLMMFLLSMPTQEALNLAGMNRHASSIVILAWGILGISLAREIDLSLFEQNIQKRSYKSFKNVSTKKIYQFSSLSIIFLSTLLALSEANGINYNNLNYSKTDPGLFSKITGDVMTPNNKKYLVVTTSKTNVADFYTAFVGKFYLFSPHVNAMENFVMSFSSFKKLLNQYDYVVILQKHYTFNLMIRRLYHHSVAPGVYKVSTLENKTSKK
ncbi:MAG: hypothetical protein ABF750_01450 [Oenococcus oeni]